MGLLEVSPASAGHQLSSKKCSLILSALQITVTDHKLIGQLSSTGSDDMQMTAAQLASGPEGRKQGLWWAYQALESLPEPNQAMVDNFRTKQVLSVKTLYLYASQDEKSKDGELARMYLKHLNERYQSDPNTASQGIGKYIHAAYESVIDEGSKQALAQKTQAAKDIEAQFFNGKPALALRFYTACKVLTRSVVLFCRHIPFSDISPLLRRHARKTA